MGTCSRPALQDSRGPRAYFRDAEMELLERHLDHAKHNSFLLVGPSGGGKTAILYELFRRVAQRERKPWLVLETSTSMLMAGTAYIGEWQTRVQELAGFAQRPLSIAVYFTDIHQLPTRASIPSPTRTWPRSWPRSWRTAN